MDSLVATIARPVTFSVKTGPARVVTAVEVFPAGTEVYVRRIKNGSAEVRVPGTLFTQRVAVSQLLVP
jgi:hypothetical protein